MKTCTQCSKEKPLDLFFRSKRAKDGRQSECKECSYSASKRWKKQNPEAHKNQARRARAKKGQLTREEYNKERSENAIGIKAVRQKQDSRRRMQKLQRTFNNNELDEFVIEQAGDLCGLREEATGFKWEVDHIVPLNHKEMSGLHVAANFQVVPMRWNRVKGNRNTNELIFGLIPKTGH